MLPPYLVHGGPLPATTPEEMVRLLTPRVKRENFYQTILENILGSGHQHIPKAGFTDITLANGHVEIKEASNYHQTVGQLQKYQIICPKPRLVVVLFGKIKDRELLRDFYRETPITDVLYFDEDDNLIPLYRATRTVSPYFSAPNMLEAVPGASW